MNRIVIILPAYNEAIVIADVIRDIQRHGFPRIIVVDDGSSDQTGVIAQQAGACVVTHQFNRGKGAATKTGIEAAKLFRASLIVTMDADGQHLAKDITGLIQPIVEKKCEVTLGTRIWADNSIPRTKVVQNMLGNAATWLLHRQWVADSQSGFRAYSRRAAQIIDTQADFYNYDSEVISEIRMHQIKYMEVPISVRYTAYTRRKPARQNFANGLRTALYMIWQRVS